MVGSIFKLIAIGGSAIIGGGTIVGQFLFSESKAPKTEEKVQEGLEAIPSIGSVCTIYEAEQWPEHRWFRKLKRKMGSKEEFFQAREQESPRIWNLETLKREVEGGCARSKEKKVYLWWGAAQNKGNTWIFSEDLNNRD